METSVIVGAALLENWPQDPFDRLIAANPSATIHRHYCRALFGFILSNRKDRPS